MAELLKKIPAETCWAITAKALTGFLVRRGEKHIAPDLGKSKGFISPLWSKEKWIEVGVKVFGDGAKQLFPMIKETFNIPIEDAISATKFVMIAARLVFGPEFEFETTEESREKVVLRWIKCPLWEIYKENKVDRAYIPCEAGHEAYFEEGFNAVNPKLTHNLTKARLRGDAYCEDIIVFKDE
ncbi:MAG: hypothetical protein ACFFCD_18000 [Promethearchaeota archaeon]